MNNIRILFIPILLSLITIGCNRGPKIIPITTEETQRIPPVSTGIFSNDGISTTPQDGAMSDDIHTVIVNEVLPTEKYIYLNVNEGEETFWIATQKKEVKKGETYFYKGGLMKTNFESKEYKRTFDRIYLVSNIVPVNHGSSEMAEELADETGSTEMNADNGNQIKNIIKTGSIRISEIIGNPKKYEGQTVQISGQCTKLNANIMGRNWIHLNDGSNEGRDMIITSEVAVPEGHVVTMKGIVNLNRDFGAGYKYDIIIEEGEIIKQM